MWAAVACSALFVLFRIGHGFGENGHRELAQPTLIETPHAPTGYVRLLKDYVIQSRGEDGSLISRFDYERFQASPDQKSRRDELRNRLLSVDPETLDPATLTAWAVNTYNFLAIDVVVEYMVTTKRYWLASIGDIGEKKFSVFDEDRFKLGGKKWSLNRFEKHFLFHDRDLATGASTGPVDPRLHFVLVCAATGCPPLLPNPLHPEHLSRDLDEATRNALRSTRQVRLEGDTLHLSKIFEWYKVDFQSPDIRGFLTLYAPAPVRQALTDSTRTLEIVPDLEWDWALNRP
jgi:hypothetical protein